MCKLFLTGLDTITEPGLLVLLPAALGQQDTKPIPLALPLQFKYQ